MNRAMIISQKGLTLSDNDPIKGDVTAAEGTGTKASRDDHVHPDLSRDPDYESGYYSYTLGQTRTFTHSLGTVKLFVYILGYDSTGTSKFHQKNYGQNTIGTSTEYSYGAMFRAITTTQIDVFRCVDDEHWDQINCFILKLI